MKNPFNHGRGRFSTKDVYNKIIERVKQPQNEPQNETITKENGTNRITGGYSIYKLNEKNVTFFAPCKGKETLTFGKNSLTAQMYNQSPLVKTEFDKFLVQANTADTEESGCETAYIPICECGLYIPILKKQIAAHWIMAKVEKKGTDAGGKIKWKTTLYDPKPYLPWPYRSIRSKIAKGNVKHLKTQNVFNSVDCGPRCVNFVLKDCGSSPKPIDILNPPQKKRMNGNSYQPIKQEYNLNAENENSFKDVLNNVEEEEQPRVAEQQPHNPFNVTTAQLLRKTAKNLFFFPIVAPVMPLRMGVSAAISMLPIHNVSK